jgi:hypothetical protein
MRDYYRLKQKIDKMDSGCRKLSKYERTSIIQMLLKTTCDYVKSQKTAVRESDFAANQRKLKNEKSNLIQSHRSNQFGLLNPTSQKSQFIRVIMVQSEI